MEKLNFKTAEFEGPLDLLLYLISKHKLDIYEISISELLEQYLSYMNELKTGGLEISSEFIEMASRLVYIKTVMLLPKHEEEGTQLKAELQGQLLEYQVCKQVAAKLGEQNRMYRNFVHPPSPVEVDAAYRLTHPVSILYAAYRDAVGRGRRRLPPPVKAFTGIVARRVVSVGSRIIHILKRLYRHGKTSYVSLFESSTDRSELVATFLAVLELVKAKRITLEGSEVCFDRSRQPEHSRSEELT
ncbi:segregation and condensation protein A [Marasmitruncus massiliensis]|uniref:segregation and condensation protein A n=1 Tax=Marasmitruncus massiliensis TaxID=1944642 RepID=UPI000C7D9D7B|nr:segregation/condensation protein A [Marasmitruncus massiliensis]